MEGGSLGVAGSLGDSERLTRYFFGSPAAVAAIFKKVYGITGNMEVVQRNRDFLRELECYICNETEAGRLLGEAVPTAEPDKVLAMLSRFVEAERLKKMIITLGGEGSVFYDGKTKRGGFYPVFPTQVRDTSGGGDAYFSGVAEALIRGMTPEAAVIIGSKLASWTISEDGPICRALPAPLF